MPNKLKRCEQINAHGLTPPAQAALIRALIARIAQSVEQGIENPRVGSSILSPGTRLKKASPTGGAFLCSPAVGAGPARERERSDRQDPETSLTARQQHIWNPVGQPLPAGKAGLSLASKLPQGPLPQDGLGGL